MAENARRNPVSQVWLEREAAREVDKQRGIQRMKQGRPTKNQPKTAYDVRRYLTLVQVLAFSDYENRILQLCKLWDVKPVKGDLLATLHALAWDVIEYHGTVQWEEDGETYGVTAFGEDENA